MSEIEVCAGCGEQDCDSCPCGTVVKYVGAPIPERWVDVYAAVRHLRYPNIPEGDLPKWDLKRAIEDIAETEGVHRMAIGVMERSGAAVAQQAATIGTMESKQAELQLKAFVEGAKWWEWTSRNATMWLDDQAMAECAAKTWLAKLPKEAPCARS